MTDRISPCANGASAEGHHLGVATDAFAPSDSSRPTTSASTFMDQLRNILTEERQGANIQNLRATLLGALEGLNGDLSPLSLDACLKAYEAVKGVLDRPRNVFKNIKMGDDTLLALFSPGDAAILHTIHSGHRATQYLHLPASPNLPENTVYIQGSSSEEFICGIAERELLGSVSRFIRKGYRMERVSETTFDSITLQPRHLMLILSCTDTITVKNVEGKEGSVLIAGQVSRFTIETIARILEVEFDSNLCDGVFQTRLA